MPIPQLSISSDEALSVATSRSGGAVVATAIGEIDQAAADLLRTVMYGLMDAGEHQVILDLEGVTFLGAAGLGVIADVTRRLGPSDAVLHLRSPSAIVRRLLTITDLEGVISLDPLELLPVRLGPEHRKGDHSLAVVAPPVQLGTRLTPSDTVVLDAALRLVAAMVSATVAGADGASVSLPRHGQLVTVASSDETVRRMDEHQYQTGEGPCLTAAAEGDWIHIESLLNETRWPTFVPRAVEEGIASILSTPLLAADRPLGALNIYSTSVGAFGPPEQELAARYATEVSGVLADAHLDVSDGARTEAMERALRSRSVIAQAQGVLMAREHLPEVDAAARLHQSARASLKPVARVAAEVVASTRADVGPEPMGASCG